MNPTEAMFKAAIELEKEYYTYEEIAEAARAIAEAAQAVAEEYTYE